jgi:E3 ubiquitin-protein ligase BRE1
MPAVELSVAPSENGLVKMEDRKRPAVDNNDSAPPLKKQATSVNGGGKPHPDTDMPWKDDLEVSLCPWVVSRSGHHVPRGVVVTC